MADSTRRALGGPGVVLVVVYGVLALAATGRSVLQITTGFDRAPLAYTLSALAAVVYILATWCLARRPVGACRHRGVRGGARRGARGRDRVLRGKGPLPRQDGLVALRSGLRLRAARAPRARPAVVPPRRAGGGGRRVDCPQAGGR